MDFGLDLGGLFGGLGSLFGSIYSANSAASAANFTNEMSIKYDKEKTSQQNWYNAQQSQIARDWSERLSNTAYQRGVQDMRAAGLNPLLAISQGGASTPSSAYASAGSGGAPSLSTPDTSAYSRIGNGFSSLAKLSKISLGLDNELKQAEIDKVKSEKVNIDSNTERSRLESASIVPEIERENRKYGNGLVGEAARYIRTLKEGLGFAGGLDSKPFATNSAKVEKAVDDVVEKAVEKTVDSPRWRHENNSRKTPLTRRKHN